MKRPSLSLCCLESRKLTLYFKGVMQNSVCVSTHVGLCLCVCAHVCGSVNERDIVSEDAIEGQRGFNSSGKIVTFFLKSFTWLLFPPCCPQGH